MYLHLPLKNLQCSVDLILTRFLHNQYVLCLKTEMLKPLTCLVQSLLDTLFVWYLAVFLYLPQLVVLRYAYQQSPLDITDEVDLGVTGGGPGGQHLLIICLLAKVHF